MRDELSDLDGICIFIGADASIGCGATFRCGMVDLMIVDECDFDWEINLESVVL